MYKKLLYLLSLFIFLFLTSCGKNNEQNKVNNLGKNTTEVKINDNYTKDGGNIKGGGTTTSRGTSKQQILELGN